MCKGEGDAFKACGDNINAVTTVVGEGRAKVVGTVSVWIPRETVVGAVESKTELTGGMDGVGGEVVGKWWRSDQTEREGVGVPRAHNIKGIQNVPEVSREVGMGGGEDGDEVAFASPH